MPQERCGNCAGTAVATYRYGVPGQDRHLPNSDIVWDGPPRHKVCVPCKGTGYRYVRANRTGTIYLLPSGDVDYERTANKQHADEQRRPSKPWTTPEHLTQWP
jgi:hypothetical protein